MEDFHPGGTSGGGCFSPMERMEERASSREERTNPGRGRRPSWHLRREAGFLGGFFLEMNWGFDLRRGLGFVLLLVERNLCFCFFSGPRVRL